MKFKFHNLIYLMICASFCTITYSRGFLAGTPIVTVSGTKSIEEIKVGDVIYAFDKVKGQFVEEKVIDVGSAITNKIATFTINEKIEIICDPREMFFGFIPDLEDKRRDTVDWIQANKLKSYNTIYSFSPIKGQSITNIHLFTITNQTKLHFIAVSNNNNFVISEEGYLAYGFESKDINTQSSTLIDESQFTLLQSNSDEKFINNSLLKKLIGDYITHNKDKEKTSEEKLKAELAEKDALIAKLTKELAIKNKSEKSS